MKRGFGVLVVALAAVIVLPGLADVGPAQATITLNSGATYQVMKGWEATAQAGQLECASFANYKNMVFDQVANDLGINRLRLEIHSGVENPVDYFAQYIDGQIALGDWLDHWHETINDNSNPSAINGSGFKFSSLDYDIDNVVLPLRQRLAAQGESLYVNLNVVAFDPGQGNSNVDFRSSPAEYGEFVLAAFLHIQSKYGWVPDAVEVILEPDMADWGSGMPVGQALAAAAQRLQAQGFTPDFIAPSTMDMWRASQYFDQMIQASGVLTYLTDLSYHRYANASDANLQAIADRAVQHNLGTAMLEHIGSGHEDLHADLKTGRNSAWQQYTLAYCVDDNGAQYYWIDESNPGAPQVNMGSRTRFLRQYFKFIRRGAQRIGATTTDSRLDPLAFINTDGRYVVVIKADAAGSFSIHGLPAGTYGIKYTTASQYDVDLPDVVIGAGQAVAGNAPDGAVTTVYGKSAQAGTATATASPTRTPSRTATAGDTATRTPSVTPLAPTSTRTRTPTSTFTPAPTVSATKMPTAVSTPEPTATATGVAPPIPTETATGVPAPTHTVTQAPAPTETATALPPMLTPTRTPTWTRTPTRTISPTWTNTLTRTISPTRTHTATRTPSPTRTTLVTKSPTPTVTRIWTARSRAYLPVALVEHWSDSGLPDWLWRLPGVRSLIRQ
jgi:hypothetical protein